MTTKTVDYLTFVVACILVAMPFLCYELIQMAGPDAKPTCTFRTLTKLDCPGCGLTRAFAAIATLDIAKSLLYHAFALVTYIGFITIFINSAHHVFRGRHLLQWDSPLLQFTLFAYLISLFLYWGIRMLTGTLPSQVFGY